MTTMAKIPQESTQQKLKAVPAVAKGFLRLLNNLKSGSLELVTPEGDSHFFPGTQSGPNAVLHIFDWSACSHILRSGDIGVAEAYRDGQIDTPDLLELLLLALANQDALEKALNGSFIGKIFYRLRHLMNRNTRSGSKKNIHAHYDIGNSFYRLWLDRSMTYSSALYSSDDMTLEQAQYAKYDRLLDNLNLKAGDQLLEIGCGWGALAERAANRGIHVTGISLSQEQLKYARARVAGTAAEALTEFRFQDYRDVNERFDAIISIEMLEAVGEQYWATYFEKVKACLKPGGKAAIQTIVIANERFDDYRKSTDFIQQYIFPGGMLPSPDRLAAEVSAAGLTLLDRYDFGLDYARTLKAWRDQFEDQLEPIMEQGFDDAFTRLWRFYYCYCEAGFLTRRTDVCQVVLSA